MQVIKYIYRIVVLFKSVTYYENISVIQHDDNTLPNLNNSSRHTRLSLIHAIIVK